MGKILYLECNSGISGDMTVGALLDLGADREALERALRSLGVDGYHLHFGRTTKNGLDAYDFDVHLEDDGHVHDHDHTHGDAHTHEHPHMHRNLADINSIIDRMDSNDRVKSLAKRMFQIVAEAESKAHGLPVEQVHFHEVGAIDSIVDILSVAVCLDNLGISEVVVSPLTEGCGHVHCQHGVIPVPVPATANIVAAYGLELHLTDQEGEMVTPTGAAIAAALRTREKLPSSCRLVKVGMGAGRKDFKQANVLRALLLESEEAVNGQDAESESGESGMWVLETNIDDSTGEMLGLAMELLLEAGAADTWCTPIFMKKGRPAYLLSVLCRQEQIGQMEELILIQTTSIGVRRYPVERTVLERRQETVETEFGTMNVKICSYKGRRFCYPEYESVKAVVKERGLDFQTVYSEIRKIAELKI